MSSSNEVQYIAGVDIGGTHITAGLIHPMARTLHEDSLIRRHVDPHASAEEIIGVWAGVLNELKTVYPGSFAKVGIAMPGPFDYDAGISLIKGFHKYESLYQLNVRELLAEETGLLPGNILFRNDAEAFLEGEMFCGAASGFDHVIGITLGTGLGSAISRNGVTWDAERSVTPYKNDIIESFVSTRGILNGYHALGGDEQSDVKTIVALYGSNDAATRALDDFTRHLSWFVEMFARKENPALLVVGGNISNAWELIEPPLGKVLQPLGVRLKKAMLGENAALIGGACCWKSPAGLATTL